LMWTDCFRFGSAPGSPYHTDACISGDDGDQLRTV
jgi:hypothetical protein